MKLLSRELELRMQITLLSNQLGAYYPYRDYPEVRAAMDELGNALDALRRELRELTTKEVTE